ncbi:hypothetical protein BOX15_Mlig021643g1 [Macrostomum lignano]|uniref:Uncharacterized protein n=1 Tax=Macrostomum lignano TaxID=282301 RepID=A0A267GEF6_9PLAT|nr:hypothetical protein BOX15_Mlig021643g1 [Macrostomum lignano]
MIGKTNFLVALICIAAGIAILPGSFGAPEVEWSSSKFSNEGEFRNDKRILRDPMIDKRILRDPMIDKRILRDPMIDKKSFTTDNQERND